MSNLWLTHPLSLLAQLDSLQDALNYYMLKYAENRIKVLSYALGCIILLVLLHRMLARKK